MFQLNVVVKLKNGTEEEFFHYNHDEFFNFIIENGTNNIQALYISLCPCEYYEGTYDNDDNGFTNVIPNDRYNIIDIIYIIERMWHRDDLSEEFRDNEIQLIIDHSTEE